MSSKETGEEAGPKFGPRISCGLRGAGKDPPAVGSDWPFCLPQQHLPGQLLVGHPAGAPHALFYRHLTALGGQSNFNGAG